MVGGRGVAGEVGWGLVGQGHGGNTHDEEYLTEAIRYWSKAKVKTQMVIIISLIELSL